MKNLYIILLVLSISTTAKAGKLDYEFDYNLDDNVEAECNDLADPFERVNRKIFYFNSFLDYITLKPLAKAYGKFVPNYTKNRVGNFVDNIYEPVTTVNYGFQGNLTKLLSSFWKFTINTTIGIGGTHNVAAQMGLNHKSQSFGSTLAYYGASPGPYVVLPLMGSTNMRDMWDMIAFDNKLNPLNINAPSRARDAYTVIRLIHKRHEIMPFAEHVVKNSTDPYVAIRSALHQRRESKIQYPANYRCGVKIKR